MPSLLRTEAAERASLLTIHHTWVELDLTEPGDCFSSVTTITFDCAEPGASTFVDFKGSQLLCANLNGRDIDLETWTDGRLPLRGLASENTLIIDGRMAYSTDGEGLHRHVDPADGLTYLYAMSFLDAGPRWFACFDQPDLKSTYLLDVQAPPEWTVIGNGPSDQIAPGQWRIDATSPMSTYYVTLVAGPYVSIRSEHDGIPLGIHAKASLADPLRAEADDIFEVTRQSLDYYHQIFGIRYPFGEYHQAFVPDFNAGAMENPGCVTFRDQYIFRAAATKSERARRASTIAHEMAHMWFGDLVTMKWWDDLWLNESFAEYMALRTSGAATQYPMWTDFGIVRKNWGYIADQSASTHPVAGNGSADAQSALADFDGISYAKGASVLKQLVAHLTDEIFLRGLNDYFVRHQYGNAEFAELIAAWTRAGAQDLDTWAAQWLRTWGLDTITVDLEDTLAVLTRETRAGEPADRTHAIQLAGFRGSTEVYRTSLRLSHQPLEIELPAGVGAVIPDVDDETWAKIRFGWSDWSRVSTVLSNDGLASKENPAARVIIYNSLRDGVRDAELAPAEALGIIVDHVPTEPEDIIVSQMLLFAQDQLAGLYSPPEERASRRKAVNDATHAILAGAAAGSDLQLTAFRRAVGSSDDVERLTAWLGSDSLPAGLALDDELIWLIVERLSTLVDDPSLIDRTLAADPSAAGSAHAAYARASLPSDAAKAAAFELIMKPSAVSAVELYATARGFFQPSQPDLTASYVERYFAEIPATADFRTGWALGQLALLAYPATQSSETTLRSAEATLARDDLAPPIRRSLVDGADQLGRAVRSLARFEERARS